MSLQKISNLRLAGTTWHLQRLVSRLEPKRVLEIGCGSAQYREVIGPSYVGLDLSAADYRPGIPRRPNVCGSAALLPFPDGSFDLVIFVNTLFELAHRNVALREASRVLVPDGTLLVFDYSRRTQKNLPSLQGESLGVADWNGLLDSVGVVMETSEMNWGSWRTRAVSVFLGAYPKILDSLPVAIAIRGRKRSSRD